MRVRRGTVVLFVLALLSGAVARGQIELQLLVGGLDQLVYVTHAGDGSGRLFVVSQRGQILVWDGSQILPTPFLDIEDRVLLGSEQGLLGLAFHPDYESNGRLFVHYSSIPGGDTVLAEYSVCGLDPNCADPASEVVLFTANQPFENHNGGGLNFGPDGYLYLALGDGGSGGDPGNRGQTLSQPLGKMLRFDVDIPAPYIPPSNPFVGDPDALDEIWAYGLRNPWRFSFDRETGDLFIGDVGENTIEEINFQPAASAGGENYGWRLMEGSECFNPPVGCNDGSLVLPVMEYPHFDGGFIGCSVTGGYRYRGSAHPDLTGLYFFADFCSGTIWSGEDQGGGTWTFSEQLDTTIGVTSFGEDEDGELYLVGFSNLYAIVGTGSPLSCTLETSQPIYDQGETLTATTLAIENVGTNVEAIRVQIGVLRPAGPPVLAFDVGGDGSLTIEPGETLDLAPLDVGAIPLGAPPGDYRLGCRLRDPASGEILVQELEPFEIQ